MSAFLTAQGLAPPGLPLRVTPLAGGVSSDIARVELPMGSICVKRALPVLKVAARWTADVRRSHHEVDWLRVASRIVPGRVPEVLAADPATGTFAMPWFDHARYPVWKTQLLDGHVEASTAHELGATVGAIHAATADDRELAARFAHDADFAALRLDPYLRASAAARPESRARLLELLERTACTRRVLVHGDVSPKNVLVGEQGPLLLDAECAWFGDPAFDAAFCLNHLLLKCVVRPQCTAALGAAFTAFTAAYARRVSWESWDELERRIASLVPALMLARVDGLSPVEYLHEDARSHVRGFAIAQLAAAPRSLPGLLAEWQSHVARRVGAP